MNHWPVRGQKSKTKTKTKTNKTKTKQTYKQTHTKNKAKQNKTRSSKKLASCGRAYRAWGVQSYKLKGGNDILILNILVLSRLYLYPVHTNQNYHNWKKKWIERVFNKYQTMVCFLPMRGSILRSLSLVSQCTLMKLSFQPNCKVE